MKSFRSPQPALLLAGALAGSAVLFYWLSSLAFFPLPWPDDSAFYLVSVEWFRWPPVYRMHSQAPFVPSYDLANFNTMPGLPFILGVGRWLGLDTTHEIRAIGYVLLAIWALLLLIWTRRKGVSRLWSWLIFLAALTSPVVKWGAGLVRPEIWQGVIGVLIFMDLDGAFRKRSNWRIPALLAAGAYIHFEAIMWVPGVMIALFPFARSGPEGRLAEWWRRLLGVGWRTTALLLPWIAYVLLHFGLFVDQMQTQFGRLQGIANPYTQDLYGLFHSIFLSFGNPAVYPKFLNPGKFVIWGALVVAFLRCIWLALGPGGPATRERAGARLGGAAVLSYSLYLWITHPEMWFITLIHIALWPLVILSLRTPDEKVRLDENTRKAANHGAAAAMALLVLVQTGVLIHLWRITRELYTQKNYESWVECIDSALDDRQTVWFPTYPDALVDLAKRNPRRDYFRHNDFPETDDLTRRLADRIDALVLSHEVFHNQAEARRFHIGEPEAEDLDRLFRSVPGRLVIKNRRQDWKISTCQQGPFWAVVSTRNG